MPLLSGKKARTKKGISENISREIKTGKSKKQAVANAYKKAGKGRRKKKKK